MCGRLGIPRVGGVHAGGAAGSPRRVPRGDRCVCLDPGRARDRDPSSLRGPRCGRCRLSRGRTEGLVRDAAQEEPGRERAGRRARTRDPRACGDRARERRPLARARHLALLRRARDLPRRNGAARVHAPRHEVGRGRAGCLPGAHARPGAVGTRWDRGSASPCCWPSSTPGSRATRPTGSSSTPRRGAWDEDGSISERGSSPPTRRSPPGSMLRRSTRCSIGAVPRATPVRCSTGSRSSPLGGRGMSEPSRRPWQGPRHLRRRRGPAAAVATDRISAFDACCPTAIPDKGRVLTALLGVLDRATRDVVPNHYHPPTPHGTRLPFEHAELAGRAQLVRRADVGHRVRGARLPHRQRLEGVPGTGRVCGVGLPAGLVSRDSCPADLHARDQGGRTATTRTSRSTMRGDGPRGLPSGCASCARDLRGRARPTPASAAWCSPTRSSSSADRRRD